MSAKLHPDMPIHQRIALIAEALAVVLNRGGEMEVAQTGPYPGNLGVYVIAQPYDDSRKVHQIDDLAREMEVLL